MVGFLFGGNTGLTYADLQDQRDRADALAKRILGQQPKTTAEGIGALLTGAALGIDRYRTQQGMDKGRAGAQSMFDNILSKITGQPSTGSASLPAPGAAAQMSSTDPTPDVSQNGSTFSPFMDTIKAGGLTNPNALAAVAATGRAESGWTPRNAARSWADPSESGQAGAAGGVMSWRADRLANLQRYAASKGEKGNGSPQTQAEFFMQEDPRLIAALNNAKSPEEAQSLMNNAWKFAGYNRPGGEAGRRMGYANAYLQQFQGGTQVASLDPSAGMQAEPHAVNAVSPPSDKPLGGHAPYQDPIVSAPNYNPSAAGVQSDASADADTIPPQTVVPQPRPQAPPMEPPRQIVPQQIAQARPQPQQVQPYQIPPEVLQFLGNPFADEGQKQAVRLMIQQQMAQNQAQLEEQTWRARQDYTTQSQQNDPLRQSQVREANARADNLEKQEPPRPITADERQQWGIPDSDTRPYAMTSEGPKLIGSSGQTINIGGQIEARKQAAEALGLKPDDPRYMGYVLGGDMPKENQQNLTAVDKKAIQEADDQILATTNVIDQLQSVLSPGENGGPSLNDRAGSGSLAGWQSWAARNDPTGLFDDKKGEATTELNNTVIGQALGSLKSIFGAAPTEGERQILLDMQASIDKTPAERKIIIDRAIKLAQRRLEFNQNRANDLRGNTYYKPGRAAAPVTIGGYTIEAE